MNTQKKQNQKSQHQKSNVKKAKRGQKSTTPSEHELPEMRLSR